jgi:Predicted transcriptional regulators
MTNLPATHDIHPVADIFPAMGEEEYAALKTDIAKHGLLEPILTHCGRVIDGRHRLRACRELGIASAFRDVECEEKNLFALVLSLNLHRRHLSTSQRAIIAARIATLKPGDNQHTVVRPNGLTTTQTETAKTMGVSSREVRRAARVIRHDEGLAQKVLRGDVSLADAGRRVTLKQAIAKGGSNSEAREILARQEAVAEEDEAQVRWQGYLQGWLDKVNGTLHGWKYCAPMYRPDVLSGKSREREIDLLERATELKLSLEQVVEQGVVIDAGKDIVVRPTPVCRVG